MVAHDPTLEMAIGDVLSALGFHDVFNATLHVNWNTQCSFEIKLTVEKRLTDAEGKILADKLKDEVLSEIVSGRIVFVPDTVEAT